MKIMAKQCKYAMKYKFGGGLGWSGNCSTCSSSNQRQQKGNHHQGNPIMGYTNMNADWYNLCVNGKSKDGTTPSRCRYYS